MIIRSGPLRAGYRPDCSIETTALGLVRGRGLSGGAPKRRVQSDAGSHGSEPGQRTDKFRGSEEPDSEGAGGPANVSPEGSGESGSLHAGKFLRPRAQTLGVIRTGAGKLNGGRAGLAPSQGGLKGFLAIVRRTKVRGDVVPGWQLRVGVDHRSTSIRRVGGQALVEFALILPVLAVLLLSVIQFAFILAAQVGITNAVREAGRLAATTTPTTTTAAATGNGLGVYDALANPSSGFLKKNVFAYSASGLVTSGPGDTMVCYTTATDASGNLIVVVRVDASYVHPVFVPLLGPILIGIDGNSGDGGLRVGASQEMRVENDQIVLPYGGGLTATPTCYNP